MAATLPTLSTNSTSHSSHNDSVNHEAQRPPRVSTCPHSPALSPTHMNFSEADTTLQQQSNRLAGLSITNATGAKVSILNDNSAESSSSPKQQSTPRSPHSPLSHSQDSFGRRDNRSDERPHHIQRYPSHPGQQHSHQHHPDSNHETGRSSSLTNASTPIYSSLELASSKSSSKSLTVASQRSRSLSSGSALSPRISSLSGATASSSPSTSASSPTYPFFTRSYSEENQSDDSESYRRMSDPSSSIAQGPTFVKRKYSCSYPGCNKCFTTSGHLARHNRIHTGERNFACLMPGCPSKFSRQDNMMQHYRTHISPKSRRGTAKKDGVPLGTFVNSSQESLSHGGREQSPAMSYYGAEYEQQHSHVAKIGGSRQGSRQNSPPRFNPLDRGGSVEYSGRHPSDSQGSGGSLRHKKSGIIQTHQHHTPLPHFNVHAMSRTQQQVQTEGQTPQPQGTLPSPLTPTISQIPTYHQHHHHQPAYVTPTNYGSGARQEDAYLLHRHAVDMSRSPSNRYRNDAPLASPTSPMTQDVERMEGVAPMLEQDRLHYRSSQLHHQHRQQQHHSHPSHAGQHQSGYQLPPLSSHGQERKMHENRSLGSHLCAAMPPSPQSTPHTPTKYRFDPIHDCLHQEKHHQHHQTQSQQHQQQHQQQDGHEMHYEAQSRFTSSHYQGGAAPEDEEMSSTTRSSIMSSASSMTSISSVSSASMPTRSQNQDSLRKQDPGEEMSGLAHLAQIVTTYG